MASGSIGPTGRFLTVSLFHASGRRSGSGRAELAKQTWQGCETGVLPGFWLPAMDSHGHLAKTSCPEMTGFQLVSFCISMST